MANYNATSETEFNTAVTNVNNGAGTDTITVTGRFNFTTFPKTFTQPVTIQGPGQDAAWIFGDAGTSGFIVLSGTGVSTVKGFTIVNYSMTGSSFGVRVKGRSQLITNMRYHSAMTKTLGLLVRTNAAGDSIPTGVCWNCRFDGARAADMQGDSVGNAPWFDSTITPGSQNVWTTENCRIDKLHDVGKNMWDHAYGAASLTRHCEAIDCSVFGHGHDANDNTARSTRLMEVYRNTFRRVRFQPEQVVRCNGGAAIVFENALVGTFNSPANAFDVQMPQGRMDGKTGSDYPLIDQPGRTTDSSLWSSAGSPPASQGTSNCYEWGNTLNGGSIDFLVAAGDSQTFIQLDRDVFNNTVKPNYIPLPWPHPLRPIEAIAAPVRGGRSR